MGKIKYRILPLENPELASEWHPTKNGDLTPGDFTAGINKKVWWLGECGHEWEASIQGRFIGKYGCPYCSNKKVLKGFNDMWTTNPELAKLLHNPEDGYKYGQWTAQRLDWKCPECNTVLKSKRAHNVPQNSLNCPFCSQGRSFPERFMSSLLKGLNIDFQSEKVFERSNRKRYDFYIEHEDKNIVIEMHGEQHYNEPRGNKGGGRFILQEVKDNDKYKKTIALKNGISHYIEVDCVESNVEYIKNSLCQTDFIHLFNTDNVDWNSIAKRADKSVLVEVCYLWEYQKKTVKEIASIVDLVRSSVRRYLHKGFSIGLISEAPSWELGASDRKRKVVKIDINNETTTYDSVVEAQRKTGVNRNNIIEVCRSKRNHAGGFKWIYFDDYQNKGILHNKERLNVQTN